VQVKGMRKLRLTALVAVLLAACASEENPVGPGSVTITQSTSTTTTTTVAPTATAQFVFAPTAPAAQQPVFFNGFGSAPGRGTRIVTFAWDFGDGTTATGMSVSHTYTDLALYVVTLTVTDDVGDSAKVSQIVGAITPPVTTTVPPPPPASSAAQYVGNQTNPLIPSDLTLFFRLLTAVSPIPDASDAAGLQAVDGDHTYTVTGTFRTPNGMTGTISGRLEGVVEPKPAGDFKGTLTANPAGCSATRNFSGPITATSLLWVAGSMVRNTCATNPLNWTELNLVQTNAPPVTTTSTSTTTTPASSTTTTTSIIVPPLTGGTITSAPAGTGLASATIYSFQYSAMPTGGTPPYTHSWNFGDGTPVVSGTAPTHVFPIGGSFTVTATVTDSLGASAQTTTPVVIGSVTGAWSVTYVGPGSEPQTWVDRVVLNQDQSQATGTVENSSCQLGSGTGTVSNVRNLSVTASLECDGVFAFVYQGTLNATLTTWTGTVSGGRTGCTVNAPCNFTATRGSALTGRRR
jgi:PKD repeat protein